MLEKNKILNKRGIKTCAFVQSNNRKRSPLMDGLPTLEDHRGLDVRKAANHLFALNNESNNLELEFYDNMFDGKASEVFNVIAE